MASMNTRLNIEKLDENIVQKHGGSKQVGLKQLGSKQVGFKQLGQKQVGFKQLGPSIETGFHGVQDEKLAKRRLEDKQPEEKTNTDCLVKERKKVHLGKFGGSSALFLFGLIFHADFKVCWTYLFNKWYQSQGYVGFLKLGRLKGVRGFLGILSLVVLGKQVRFSFVSGFKKSDYLEYKDSMGSTRWKNVFWFEVDTEWFVKLRFL
ncbi:hypothetical protein Tco_0828903 [Tanacetum coccineum]